MLSRRKITGDLLVLLTGGLLALAPAGCSVSGAAGRLTWDRKPVLDHSPRFPAGEWERPQRAVLEGFLHAYQPCVIETDDSEYPYRMWFFGWIVDPTNPEYPGCDAIYHARSRDQIGRAHV